MADEDIGADFEHVVPEVGAAAAQRAAILASLKAKNTNTSTPGPDEGSPRSSTVNCISCGAVLLSHMRACPLCSTLQPLTDKPQAEDSNGFAIPPPTSEPADTSSASSLSPNPPFSPSPSGAPAAPISATVAAASLSKGFMSFLSTVTKPAPAPALTKQQQEEAQRQKELKEQKEREAREAREAREQKERETREANERRARMANTAVDLGYQIERTNLSNMLKIAVKALIESSVGLHGKLCDDAHPQLHHLAVLLESLMRHGLKDRKNGLAALFERASRQFPEAEEVVTRVRQLPQIKSQLGKARACLRMTLIAHTLPTILSTLIEMQPQVLFDLYEKWAFIVSDKGQMIPGLLMGLQVLDLDFNLDAERLDTDTDVVDLSLYLKDGNYLRPAVVEEDEGKKEVKDERFSEKSFLALTNELSMVKEVSKRLSDQLAAAVKDRDAAQEEKDAAVARAAALEAECAELRHAALLAREEADRTKAEFERKFALLEADINTERSTYQQSREGLNTMIDAVMKQVQTEKDARESIEADRNALRGRVDELDNVVKGLKDDITDKEETMNALRKQLKDVKALNLNMLAQMQEQQAVVRQKEGETHGEAQAKADALAEVQRLQGKLRDAASATDRLETTLLEVTNRLKDVDSKRAEHETNLLIERQWRESLQKDMERLKEKLEEADLVRSQLKEVTSAHETLLKQYQSVTRRTEEQEQTLMELGEQLSEKALKVVDLETKRKVNKEKVWADDSKVTTCQGCEQPFNLTRRKHHCRSCGGVFCQDCSDNKMPLPSSAKPVRVCDKCETELIAQQNH